MGRFRIPEIALGFLLATALWAAVAVIYPQNHTDETRAGQSADRVSTDERLANYTLAVAIFTAILAASTIGLWIVTWRSGVRQSRDMKGALVVARQANEINLKHMIADQRAWLSVGDLEVTRDIVFSAAQGGAVLFVSVKITNIGKTPALNAHTYMDVVFDYLAAPEAMAKIARSARDTKTTWTRVVLPGDFYKREWALDLPTPDKGTHIHPIVVGCTTYSIVPDGTFHQTGFVFGLFEKDQATGRFKFPLQVNVPRIPKEIIGWDAGTGGFAD